MGRKQITYAHKRYRNKTKLVMQSNSPLHNANNLEEPPARTEITQMMLKRSHNSGSPASSGLVDSRSKIYFKKAKLSHHKQETRQPIFPLNQDHDLQTPHPTLLTESQAFKIQSSRGSPLAQGHEFSPVPLGRISGFSVYPNERLAMSEASMGQNNLPRMTSSQNLKENNAPLHSGSALKAGSRLSLKDAKTISQHVTRSKSKTKAPRMPLASPFTSQPTSPQSSSKMENKLKPGLSKTRTNNVKRTLSDTYYNANLPSPQKSTVVQTQSTTNSPTQRVVISEGVKERRPSAPSAIAQRPDVASWFVSNPSGNAKANLSQELANSLSIFDLNGPVSRRCSTDFNRPPSQLSYTTAYNEKFFDDVLGISTPFGVKKLERDAFSDSPDSTDNEDENRYALDLLPLHSDLLGTSSPSRLECSRSTWWSDSLISPPTFSQKRAYSNKEVPIEGGDQDFDMTMHKPGVEDGNDSLGLGKTLMLERSPIFESTRTRQDSKHPKGIVERRESLQDLFSSLDLGFSGEAPRLPVLSQDLGSEKPQSTIQTQVLQSPAYISPFKTKHLAQTTKNKPAGRDRRGTIRASDFQPQRQAPGIVLTSNSTEPRRTRSGTVTQGPARSRRERSDTIIAHPPSISAISDRIVAQRGNDGDVYMQGFEEGQNNQTNSHKDVDMSGDEEDELDVITRWVGEKWAVAEPSSPKVPRRTLRKRRVAKNWKIGWEMGRGLGTWSMREHDEDDGVDDPLLLK